MRHAAREGALNKLSPALGAGKTDMTEFRGRGGGHHKVLAQREIVIAAAFAAAHSLTLSIPAPSAGLRLFGAPSRAPANVPRRFLHNLYGDRFTRRRLVQYISEADMETAKVFGPAARTRETARRIHMDAREVGLRKKAKDIILKALPENWSWLDAIAGKLDDDFVNAVQEQPPVTLLSWTPSARGKK